MAFDPMAVLTSLGGAGGLSSNLIQNIALGAGTSVVLAGLKTNAGMDAIDPLHLIPGHAANPNGSVVVGKSITSAAFNALTPAAQTQVLQQGYVIAG